MKAKRLISSVRWRPFAVLANLLLLAANACASHPPVPASVALLPSASGAGNAFSPAFSADGRVIVFLSHANNLVTNDDLAPHLDLFARDRITGNTILVSVNTNGIGGGNDSIGDFSVSSNGQFIVFESAASNLVPGDANGTWDVFLRDLSAGTTRLISRNFAGNGSGNGPSRAPQISADARRVAFESAASDLVPGDTNGLSDIFAHAIDTGLTTLASADTIAAGPASGPCDSAALSLDGRFVAFVKRAGNPVPGSARVSAGEIYLRNLETAVTLLVSTNVAARMPLGSSSFNCFNPVISSEGRFVAFLAQASGLQAQLFWRDMNSPSPASVTTNAPPDSLPSMSADGRFLAYVGGGNAFTNGLYIWDGAGFSNRLVCPIIYTSPLSSTRLCSNPTISADGSRVAYFNYTNFLSATSMSIHDWATGSNWVVLAADGKPAPPYDASFPVLSADGRQLAFESAVDNLVAGDQNGAVDVFHADLDTGVISLLSARHSTLAAVTGRGISSIAPGALSRDGRRVAFLQSDSALRPFGSNRWADAVLRDLATGTNTLLSANFLISGSPFLPGPSGFVLPPTNRALPPKLSMDSRIASFPGAGVSTNTFWRDLAGATNRALYMKTSPVLSMSADGRIVTFSSVDPIAIPTWPTSDNNFSSDILLFAPDRRNFPQGAPELVPVSVTAQNWVETGNSHSINPVVSADGGWIAFQSLSTNLTADPDVFPPVYQLFATRVIRSSTNTDVGVTRLASYSTIASLGQSGVSAEMPLAGGATNAVFSGDSRFLFFETPGSRAIFRHDLSIHSVTNISSLMGLFFTNRARLTNLAVCADCANPAPDFTGRFVAYESPFSNSVRQIWLRDMVNGSEELISASPGGIGGNGSSTGPLLSIDARFVVFTSKASNLVANDTNRATDVFVRDRQEGVTHCLSMNRFGSATGNRASSNPVLSPDGRTVAFQSFASDLVDGDYNDTRDVFVASLAGPDSDGDGLDDDWEVTFFNNLSRDGSGDFDADGVSDGQEFRQGTDPTNAGSVFRVLTLTTVTSPQPQPFAQRSTAVFWAAAPFRSYRVQYKNDLEAPWTDLAGDVVATGNTASKTHLVFPAGSSRAFYRVRLLD